MSNPLDALEFSNSYTVLDGFEGYLDTGSRKENVDRFAKALGKRLAKLIAQKGYKSPYGFWLEHGDEGLSRSNLNYILNGKGDPKLSTLRRIAEGLEVSLSELLKDL